MTTTTTTLTTLGRRFNAHVNLLTTRLAAFQAACALDFAADVERVRAATAERLGVDLGQDAAIDVVIGDHRRARQAASRSLNASIKTMDRLADALRRVALDAEAEADLLALDRARAYHDAARANVRNAQAKRLDAILGR
jgi:hypothetical protein